MPVAAQDAGRVLEPEASPQGVAGGADGARPLLVEGAPCLDHDALDLVDRDRVRRPVVELRRLRRRVARDLLRVLQGSSVRQIRRDPRRPERVAARRGREPRGRGTLA